MALMSPPALNALPAPVSTTARTSRSAEIDAHAASISRDGASKPSTLRVSGELRVMTAMPSAVRRSMKVAMGSSDRAAGGELVDVGVGEVQQVAQHLPCVLAQQGWRH